MTTEYHAIVTTDPYTGERRRHDIPGTKRAAMREARERHGHDSGVDTSEIVARYHGVVPSIPVTENIITVEMLEALRRKHDGVIVADADGEPLVRSRIHYDGPDPLDTGQQIIVIDGDPAHDQELTDVTDEEIAADLSERWADLVNEALTRIEMERS